MPPRRNKEKFQQLTEFERRRIIGFREGGFSYPVMGARGQRNSYTEMCTNVGFVNSWTSAAPWIAGNGVFIQDPPHGKPSMAAFVMSS
ncbi:hypothetical protein TNCV_1850741 [Trichonephila clavipes]|nr:hypothetical protein TNCV_1850741 [Trichonephila clavipes]